MPLFGKKDVSKKTKKDAEKSQSIEDKYDVKDLLGTWVQSAHTFCYHVQYSDMYIIRAKCLLTHLFQCVSHYLRNG